MRRRRHRISDLLNNSIDHAERPDRGESGLYYWIHGHANGKPFVYFGGTSYEEANRKGYQLTNAFFEVTGLNTRDPARATRILKGKDVDETGDIGRVLRSRYSHQPPGEQL